MAVPRNRLSNSRKNLRRAHHAKKPRNLSNCSNCGATQQPHTYCASCGHYAGQAVVAVKRDEE